MNRTVEKIFYGPPDWVVEKTSVRTRRAINFWVFAMWVFPGLPLWIWWKNAIWFIGFMSLFALWWTGWGSFGTETPVENEKAEDL